MMFKSKCGGCGKCQELMGMVLKIYCFIIQRHLITKKNFPRFHTERYFCSKDIAMAILVYSKTVIVKMFLRTKVALHNISLILREILFFLVLLQIRESGISAKK